jgi:hypothetical protein
MSHCLLFGFDNIQLFLKLIDFKTEKRKNLIKYSQFFWTCFAGLTIIKNSKDMKLLNEKEEDEKKKKLKKKVLITNSLSNAFDLLICLNGSNISKNLFGRNIPPQIRGLGGVLAPSFALYSSSLNSKI